MKPVKRKRSKLKEVETKDKNVSAFLKDKNRLFLKSRLNIIKTNLVVECLK